MSGILVNMYKARADDEFRCKVIYFTIYYTIITYLISSDAILVEMAGVAQFLTNVVQTRNGVLETFDVQITGVQFLQQTLKEHWAA